MSELSDRSGEREIKIAESSEKVKMNKVSIEGN